MPRPPVDPRWMGAPRVIETPTTPAFPPVGSLTHSAVTHSTNTELRCSPSALQYCQRTIRGHWLNGSRRLLLNLRQIQYKRRGRVFLQRGEHPLHPHLISLLLQHHPAQPIGQCIIFPTYMLEGETSSLRLLDAAASLGHHGHQLLLAWSSLVLHKDYGKGAVAQD